MNYGIPTRYIKKCTFKMIKDDCREWRIEGEDLSGERIKRTRQLACVRQRMRRSLWN